MVQGRREFRLLHTSIARDQVEGMNVADSAQALPQHGLSRCAVVNGSGQLCHLIAQGAEQQFRCLCLVQGFMFGALADFFR